LELQIRVDILGCGFGIVELGTHRIEGGLVVDLEVGFVSFLLINRKCLDKHFRIDIKHADQRELISPTNYSLTS
jgi:hypothetical protein